MSKGDDFDFNPDEEFYSEVDAFIASIPEDGQRVQRITASMPDSFHEVLEQQRAARVVSFEPAASRNWSVLAASAAVAAALVGMLVIWLLPDSGGGGAVVGNKPPITKRPEAKPRGEFEFLVMIKADGKPEVRPTRVAATDPVESGDDQTDAPIELVNVPEPVLPVEDVGSWFLKKPEMATPPEVAGDGWARTAIDRFVLAALEERGMEPVEDADRLALLRRLSYDLTGLPPSPELVERFLHNQSPAAYGNVVEDLMATWQFGEHWARHWLDVAGYDPEVPEAWRYREYVIAALNSDKPFDQFVKEQLAGDLIPVADIERRAEAQIATGFLAMAGGRDLDGQVDHASVAFMGMAASCSRCHDHPYYPVTGRDFNALAGIFGSTRLLDKPATLQGLHLDGAKHPAVNQVEDGRVEKESQRLRGLISSSERRLARALERFEAERVRRLRAALADLNGQLVTLEQDARDQVVAAGAKFVGAQDRVRPTTVDGVPRGVMARLADGVTVDAVPAGSSGRLELANWLVDENHPLTARVFVNRVWGQLFGSGLVATSEEIGLPGTAPSHPELLDYLAVKFVEDGWSVKSLLRQMVTARVYQLSEMEDAENLLADAGNRYLWRRAPRELPPLDLRDSVLAVAGWQLPAGAVEQRMFARKEFRPIPGLEQARAYRSIYLGNDAGQPDESLVFEAAVAAAERRGSESLSGGVSKRVKDAFVATLGRKPDSEELQWAVEVIKRGRSLKDGGSLAAVAWPDRMGARADYLEGLLPKVTVRIEDGKPVKKDDRVVAWAMLYHALMMTEEFRSSP